MADVATVTALCLKLHAIDHPKEDPNTEVTLRATDIRAPEPITRTEGVGAVARLIGPRYAAYWPEATRLATIIDVLEER